MVRDVLAAREGDAEAFGRLVRGHGPMVTALATAILGTPDAGEEVAQEVFVHAWRGLPALREPASFVPWLRQMTRNRAQDALRRTLRRKEDREPDALAEIQDPQTEMDDVLDEVRQEERLWAAFQRLPDDDREVLALFYRQDSSVRAVAEVLELEEAAVRKRLSRARARLKEGTLAALGTALARTVPGLAFAAAVTAGLCPAEARAQVPSRGRAPLVSALVGALVLGVWWVSPRESSAPLPSQTPLVELALAELLSQPPQAQAPASETAVSLAVSLGGWTTPNQTSAVDFRFPAAGVWSELSLPQNEPLDALLALVEDGKDEPIPVELAQDVRASLLKDDPWSDIVLLELARLEDPSRTLELARQAQARWPDHLAGELAGLYLLGALGDPQSDTHDPDAFTDEAIAMLRRGLTPLNQWLLADLFSRAGDPDTLSPEDLDVLQAIPDEITHSVFATSLEEVALEAALRLGDLERADRWMDRQYDWVEQSCTTFTSQGGFDIAGHLCALERAQQDQRSSWLAAQGARAPESWQAALSAAVRRCGTLERALTGEARFDGTWTWSAWSEPGPFAACIASAQPLPAPPSPTLVKLEVLP